MKKKSWVSLFILEYTINLIVNSVRELADSDNGDGVEDAPLDPDDS